MCQCTPAIRTPWCGRPGCLPPKQESPPPARKGMKITIEWADGTKRVYHPQHEPMRKCIATIRFLHPDDGEVFLYSADPLGSLLPPEVAP